MFSKINHVAIVSENYAQLAQFYIAAFGMKTSDKTRPGRAVTVRDGYVGLNINPRRAGRSAGLDHFGIQVEDTETVLRAHAQEISDREMAQAPVDAPVRRHHARTIPTATCSTSRRRTWRTAPRSMSRTTARPTRATSTTWRCAR